MEILENSKINPSNQDKSNPKLKPSGIQKAAMLVMALGEKASNEIFRHLSSDESQRLLQEVIRLKSVSNEEIKPVLDELSSQIGKGDDAQAGGVAYANYLLEKSLGKTKARDVISHLRQQMNRRPFKVLADLDPEVITELIKDEHHQTIAVILYHLKPDKASKVLKSLPKDVQIPVAKRIAKIKTIDERLLQNIEEGLTKKFEKMKDTLSTVKVGGLTKAASILQHLDPVVSGSILQELTDDNPELAESLRGQLFTFNDVIRLPDQQLENLLTHIHVLTISKALIDEQDFLIARFMANVSEQRAVAIQQHLSQSDIFSPADKKAAQNEVVKIAQKLIERGIISLQKKDDMFDQPFSLSE